MRQLSKGVWSVMLTPFHDDGRIDVDGLKRIIDFYIDNGCAGLFAACSSSEVMCLTQDEILQLCHETIKHVNGRVQVVGGAISSGTRQEQIEFIRRISDTGIDATVVTTNQMCRQDDSEAVWMKNFQELLDGIDVPLGIYESPFPFKRLLSLDEMAFLCDSGRVVFHKDTCCDALQIRQKLAVTKRSALAFYNANVDTLVSSLKDGAAGYCGTACNFYPELMQFICDNHHKPELIRNAAEFIQRGESAFCNTYPLAGKYFLRQRGVDIKLNCRVEVNPLTDHDISMLSKLYADWQDVKTMHHGAGPKRRKIPMAT